MSLQRNAFPDEKVTSLTATSRSIKQTFDDAVLSMNIRQMNLPFACHSILANDDYSVLCLSNDKRIYSVDTSTAQFKQLRYYDDLEHAKIFVLPNKSHAYLYGRDDHPTLLIDLKTSNDVESYNVQFLQIEQLSSLFVGRTAQEPKKLQLFRGTGKSGIEGVVGRISINRKTQWTVVNDYIVKLPQDERGIIKLYQVEIGDKSTKHSKPIKLKYAPLKGKKFTISHVQAWPENGLITFTVHTDQNKCRSYIVDIKNKKVLKHFDQVEAISKFSGNSFLCLNAADHTHGTPIVGNFSIYKVEAEPNRSREYPVDNRSLAYISMLSLAPNGNIFFITKENNLGIIVSPQFSPTLNSKLPQAALASDAKLEGIDDSDKTISPKSGTASGYTPHASTSRPHPSRFHKAAKKEDMFTALVDDAEASFASEFSLSPKS